VVKYAKKFGTYAIIVSLCSGCASVTPQPDPRYMTIQQLGMFVPNCKIRDQQLAMLMSQYVTDRDEMAFSWRGLTGEARWANQIIRSHVIYLREYC
jgi:hypothetical protein